MNKFEIAKNTLINWIKNDYIKYNEENNDNLDYKKSLDYLEIECSYNWDELIDAAERMNEKLELYAKFLKEDL